jgi:hypothetical protein
MLRARLETVLAAAAALLAVLTAVRPTWIEAVTRLDPDGGSGAAEWGLVAVLAMVALAGALLARRDYRAAAQRPAAAPLAPEAGA